MARPLPTVEQVRAAYEKLKSIGIVPIRGRFIDFGYCRPMGCCALGAVYLAESGLARVDPRAGVYAANTQIKDWSIEQFGLTAIADFGIGFDDRGTDAAHSTAYEQGRAVARAVFGNGERTGDAR